MDVYDQIDKARAAYATSISQRQAAEKIFEQARETLNLLIRAEAEARSFYHEALDAPLQAAIRDAGGTARVTESEEP